MPVVNKSFAVKTSGHCDCHDITDKVHEAVVESGVENGIATVFICGSTASVTTLEFEQGAIADLKRAIEQLAPEDDDYQHNLKWHDGNGFSHVRASLLKASLTVPFSQSKLLLGSWQQIVLIDFDNRSRNRKVIVQVMGE
jgi:secondary thiamine-phosphate synthase enzyme